MNTGEDHLRRATGAMLALAVLGIPAWGFLRSWPAALSFAAGAAASLAYWGLHRYLTGRMLTPSVRQRWFYGLLSLGKLALLALVLRGMMEIFPTEALALTTGILLFVAGILLEAIYLVFQKPEATQSD